MLDVQRIPEKRFVWDFNPPKLRGGGNPDFGPIMAFIERLIEGVMSFYTDHRSEAVMCPELRRRINDELAYIIPQAVKTFDLEPIDLVLRVRTTKDPGILLVRAEKPDLN